MTPREFVALAGPEVLHITPRQNADSIAARALLCAADLACEAGTDPNQITLRQDRQHFTSSPHSVTLNHQRPLLMGAKRAGEFLDGHTLASWAAQLDQRIFFWPAHKGRAFAQSLDQDTQTYCIDTERFFRVLHADLDLSPINSGNAARRPARRGDWLYFPADAAVAQFRNNRRARGLVKTPDTLVEISLRCPMPAALLKDLCR